MAKARTIKYNTFIMNQLGINRRSAIVKALCEGNSIRSTSRMTGAAVNTVIKLVTEIGAVSLDYQDAVMHDLPCRRIQCDGIWSFAYSKAKKVPVEHREMFGYGDVWTWVAFDADTKLVPCWQVGSRHGEDAFLFMTQLAMRLANRVQLTTDGHRAYLEAADGAFGSESDYATLVTLYRPEPTGERRYSPPLHIGANRSTNHGNPNKAHVPTSLAERQNLTVRMSMRRFTRLTDTFSKKLQRHMHALALHFIYYNFCRAHKSSSNPYPTTPAMAAGVTDHVWSIAEVISLLERSN